MQRTDIRLGLPSKGRLETASLDFLERCGLRVVKPNPRQYQAGLPAIPALNVLFQRPGDIVAGVRSGSLDFGITGLDSIQELSGEIGAVITLHDALGFGQCSLELAVPEEWAAIASPTTPLSTGISSYSKLKKSCVSGLRNWEIYPEELHCDSVCRE